MDSPMSAASFTLMGLMFKVRDLVKPRSEILKEAGIEPGHQVLDYGCGPGSYVLPAAQLTGPAGRIASFPVAEWRPLRSAFSFTPNLPNPETRTSSPDGRGALMFLGSRQCHAYTP